MDGCCCECKRKARKNKDQEPCRLSTALLTKASRIFIQCNGGRNSEYSMQGGWVVLAWTDNRPTSLHGVGGAIGPTKGPSRRTARIDNHCFMLKKATSPPTVIFTR